MVIPLLMASKQSEKSKDVAYNDCGLSLCNIAKKLNCHHLSMFSLKIIRKLEIIIKKKVVATKEKSLKPKIQKWLEQGSALQHHKNSKISWIFHQKLFHAHCINVESINKCYQIVNNTNEYSTKY